MNRSLKEMVKPYQRQGLTAELSAARVCQDIVLKAISKSSLGRNVTVKGGVVMRSLTQDVRRSTRDLDLDFVHYSLSDESIRQFVETLNCLQEFLIVIVGNIEELKHQDYHGKSASVKISDEFGSSLTCNIDFGVHKHLELEQDEFCFDVCAEENSVCLFRNSIEQIFAEKLRSLLIFGSYSSRFKDVFDMFYIKDHSDITKLKFAIKVLVLDDEGMRENSFDDIFKRVVQTFKDKLYVKRLDGSRQRWISNPIDDVVDSLLRFIEQFR